MPHKPNAPAPGRRGRAGPQRAEEGAARGLASGGGADVRVETLALIVAALAGTPGDAEAALDILARRGAALLGDGCLVNLLTEPGHYLLPVAAEHPNAEARRLLRDLLGSAWLGLHESLNATVLQQGRPLLLPTLAAAELPALAAPAYAPYLERVGISSVLIVPILGPGQVIGTISLVRDRGGRPYTPADQSYLQELAYYAALIVENARLFQIAEEAGRRQDEAQTLRDAIFASALDALIILDGRLLTVEANPAACTLVGVARGELRTRNALEFVPPARRSEAQQLAGRLLAEGVLSGEFAVLRRDGEIRPVEFRARAHIRPGYHLLVLRDSGARPREEPRATWEAKSLRWPWDANPPSPCREAS